MSDIFCILPWIHLTVFPEGSAKICCVANQRISESGRPISLGSHSLDGVWNSQYMRSVRRDMAAGRPVADCEHCYHAERAFGTSHRTHSNARWEEELGSSSHALVERSAARDFAVAELPIYYQLMPGNLCNLKCRMCFSTFSSMIERDEVHRRWSGPLFEASSGPSGTVDFSAVGSPGASRSRLPDGPWFRDDAWVREVLLSNAEELRGLYFTGGEPMLEKQVEKILGWLIERGVAGNVNLEFNTNCTILRDDMLAKLQQFKDVVLSLSLDAYGPFHEYIRYPSNWHIIERNVGRLTGLVNERFHLSAAPVLQVYNALNITEVLRFLDQKQIHFRIAIASLPWFVSVDLLPPTVRRVAAARLRTYAQESQGEPRDHVLAVAAHLEAGSSPARHDSLRTLMLFTNDLDAGRKQSFPAIHHELVNLLAADGFTWTDERSSPEPSTS